MKISKLLTVSALLFSIIGPLQATDKSDDLTENQPTQAVIKNNNNVLSADILMLIFQYSGMVKPSGTVCKYWEKVRSHPSVSISVELNPEVDPRNCTGK